MSYVRSAIVAVVVSSLPVWAGAAPIDINAAGYELAVGSDKTVSITADGTGVPGTTLTPLDFFFAVDLTTNSALDALNVTSAASYALYFDADGFFTDTASATFGATEISLMDGVIELLFESFTGSGVYAGVDALLVTYSNANLTNAANGYDDFFDAQGDTSTLRVQGLNDIAPIPLPAGLPLMIGGLACFAWMRRSKKA